MLDQHPAPSAMYQVVTDFRLSRAIWCAARLRLPDAIGDGPASVEEIATATATHAPALRRLLDALTAAGLFRSEGPGRYGPTPMSDLLRSDHPQSQRALVEVLLGGSHFDAWGAIETSIRTGQTAFDAHFVMSWVEYYTAHPEEGHAFAEAMTGMTRAFEDAILAANPFPPFTRAVDVGGSHGSLLRRLLELNPDATGIVFDLPDVIAGWPERPDDPLAGRITGVGGDFFVSVPGGADLYVLKLILHDWDDDRAETILRTVRKAMAPQARLALVDTVLPESPIADPGWLRDLNMMAITGGCERSEQAFTRLLDRTGFRLDRVVATQSPLSVVLASPA
jgi:hypothetical protein